MKKQAILSFVVVLASAGAASASVPVVKGAVPITAAEKSDATGRCGYVFSCKPEHFKCFTPPKCHPHYCPPPCTPPTPPPSGGGS